MNHAPRRYPSALFRRVRASVGLAVACSACGFGGRLDLGDNGGTAGTAALPSASGGALSGGASAMALGGANAAGSEPGTGGAGTVRAGDVGGSLWMDATGIVPLSSNDFGIHGKWYAYS